MPFKMAMDRRLLQMEPGSSFVFKRLLFVVILRKIQEGELEAIICH